MEIENSNGKFIAKAGAENKPVRYVSRVNAARYCNYLTSKSPDKGAHVIDHKLQNSGQKAEVIVGYRDLTSPEGDVVYYLPDMHEFYKAGWYAGNNKYRVLNKDNALTPSKYGVVVQAGKLGNWVDSKYYGTRPIALGGNSLNTEKYHILSEHLGSEKIGFRVAATAPLQVCKQLNSKRNLFFAGDNKAVLKLRSIKPETVTVKTEYINFKKEVDSTKTTKVDLKKGLNSIELDLPKKDGYYDLLVTVNDKAPIKLPLAVMHQHVNNGAEGNYGFTCHITKSERQYDFEDVDLKQYRDIGSSILRYDIRWNDNNGCITALKRIKDAGLTPLPILRNSHRTPRADKKTADKWAAHGIGIEYAGYAEQIYNLVSECKKHAKYWEVGNEPTYWKELPEDYAQSLKTAYIAIKLADPEAVVMAGDLNAIHAPVFKAKGGEFCDAIAHHLYGFYVPSFWGISGKFREINGWKKAAGIPDKPIWETEIGACNYSHIYQVPVKTYEQASTYQAMYQPKILAGSMAFGAAKVLPYNYRATPLDYLEEDFGLLDRYGYPKPAISAFRTTAMLLGRAKFKGFLKGHGFAAGKIVGLYFVDPEGRDIIVYWRNDIYSANGFSAPWDKVFNAPQSHKLKVKSSEVEFYDLCGGKSTIKAKGGYVTFPVCEFPVFVRGKLSPTLENVSTAHNIPKINFQQAKVRITPVRKRRSCDTMEGMTLKLTKDTVQDITVHLYNLENKPLKGTLSLNSRPNWRQWAWKITPESKAVEVLPNGMAAVTFSVPVPATDNLTKNYYLDAIFDSEEGKRAVDTVVFQVIPLKWNEINRWRLYKKGYKLNKKPELFTIERAADADRSVLLCPSHHPIIAKDAGGFNKKVTFSFTPSDSAINTVNLLVRDATGEIFQIRQRVNVRPNKKETVTFDLTRYPAGEKLVIYGGNKDKKLDYPVKLHGFIFDYDRGAGKSTVKIEAPTFKSTPKKAVDGGGGAIDMD